jgi:hypothetical protein
MAYSLTLHIYPSPYGVDWTSPRSLTRSVFKNAISGKPRMIGHVSIQLEGPGETDMAGMSSTDLNRSRRLILIDGMGLGVLYHRYPGLVEDAAKLNPEIEDRMQKGNFSFVRFEISKESFERVKQYLREYREKNIGRYYGLPFRPRYGEGAGCSAFAASILEVAGVMNEEFRKQWSGQVRLPEEFVGEPGKGKRKVGVWKLLLPTRKNARWAHANEEGRDMFFWDPDMMHAWVMKTWDALQQSQNQNQKQNQMRTMTEQNSKGILVDSSKNAPTSEPIWLG